MAASLLASEVFDHFVCGILAHPSINLEERMYGGSLVELFSHVQRPLLILPARGDPHEYDSFVQLLKYRCPSSDLIDYRGFEHNFLLRGTVYNIYVLFCLNLFPYNINVINRPY